MHPGFSNWLTWLHLVRSTSTRNSYWSRCHCKKPGKSNSGKLGSCFHPELDQNAVEVHHKPSRSACPNGNLDESAGRVFQPLRMVGCWFGWFGDLTAQRRGATKQLAVLLLGNGNVGILWNWIYIYIYVYILYYIIYILYYILYIYVEIRCIQVYISYSISYMIYIYIYDNIIIVNGDGPVHHGKPTADWFFRPVCLDAAQGPQDWPLVRCPEKWPRKKPWFSMASVQEL